jgi:hypothetical protein
MERLTERNPLWIDDELWERACEPDCEEIDTVYRKLKEYEDLEEQGRLIKLPCKVGDTVYLIKDSETIVEREADMMFIGILWEEFGKEWFPTREEAEAKLKELRGEEDEI